MVTFPQDFSFSFWYYPLGKKKAKQMTLDSSEYDLISHADRLLFRKCGSDVFNFTAYEINFGGFIKKIVYKKGSNTTKIFGNLT